MAGNNTILELILQEKQRRLASSKGNEIVYIPTIEPSPGQRVILDSKSRFISVLGTRRAGKSRIIVEKIVKVLLSVKKANILYVGLTRESAQAIVWRDLLDVLDEQGIPYYKNQTKLEIQLNHNKSRFSIFGSALDVSKDRLRGTKFHLAIIDEAAFIHGLAEFVGVLLPTLADYRGQLILLSSPNGKSGLFFESYEGSQKHLWEKVKLTMDDNPLFGPERAKEERDLVLRTKYRNDSSNGEYRQEWLGQFVTIVDSLVYRFQPFNIVESKPIIRTNKFILSIDFGIIDKTAFVIGELHNNIILFRDSFAKSLMSVDEINNKINEFKNKYPINVIIGDTGGLGKAVAYELSSRYNVEIMSAKKVDKKGAQQVFNNSLINNEIQILVPECQNIIDEWSELKLLPDGSENSNDNHLSDATLYGFRYLRNLYEALNPLESEEEKQIREMLEYDKMLEKEENELNFDFS